MELVVGANAHLPALGARAAGAVVGENAVATSAPTDNHLENYACEGLENVSEHRERTAPKRSGDGRARGHRARAEWQREAKFS